MIAVSARRYPEVPVTLFLLVATFPLSADAQIPEAEHVRLDGRSRPPVSTTARRSRSTAVSTKPSGSAPLPAADFIQVDPANGTPATEPTEVRIVFTQGRHLHGRHLLRLRAGQVARVPASPRRVPAGRRSLHVDHRYVPRRTIGLLLRDEPVRADGRFASSASTATIARGTASGTRACVTARSAGRSRSRSLSARSTSIRTTRPGDSTSSAPSAARTRTASGWDGRGTRGSGA